MITLDVADLPAAARFHESLGFSLAHNVAGEAEVAPPKATSGKSPTTRISGSAGRTSKAERSPDNKDAADESRRTAYVANAASNTNTMPLAPGLDTILILGDGKDTRKTRKRRIDMRFG